MNAANGVYSMPTPQLVKWLIEHNRLQSDEFCSPDAKGLRMQYRARHPTKIIAFKCMDGRLNLAVMTKTPLGIIEPMRNLGGRFDMGWPLLGEVVTESVQHAVSHGNDVIMLVTYHYSTGDVHRGCRGFNYDASAARAYTAHLVGQISRMFGHAHAVVYPVQVGIETDRDALVLHGAAGSVLDVSTLRGVTASEIKHHLTTLFPDMKSKMIHDLLPLVDGNAAHVAEVACRETLDAEHRERILGIGRGFDWLHLLNLALLVGPFDPNLDQAIITACGLLKGNLDAGRVPRDGVILLACAPYREETGFDRPRALEKANFLSHFAREAIDAHVSDLSPLVFPMTGLINVNTRRLEPIV